MLKKEHIFLWFLSLYIDNYPDYLIFQISFVKQIVLDFHGRCNIYINVSVLSEAILYQKIIQPLPEYCVYFLIHVEECFYINFGM